MNYPEELLKSLVQQFQIKGKAAAIVPFGNGHIHDTFHVRSQYPGCTDYLLQRINHRVFTRINGMMNNINAVIEHLKGRSDRRIGVQCTPELIKTRSSRFYLQDDAGNYWRVYDFKSNTRSYDVAETPEQVYEGAKTFGRFLYKMSDFDPGKLVEPIPHFHNVIFRLDQLSEAMGTVKKAERKKTEALIQFVREHADEMCRIEKMKQRSKLPLRVTHNDTKFNNILFDEYDKGVCVIDLDTVMPGIVHYDFGDGVRTAANSASEDEQDVHNIHFDEQKFKAFCQGYLDGANGILEAVEIASLGSSSALFAYMMGVRFLTDHLNNNVYFKVSHPDQNLQRAAGQFTLAGRILERQNELDNFIKKIGLTV